MTAAAAALDAVLSLMSQRLPPGVATVHEVEAWAAANRAQLEATLVEYVPQLVAKFEPRRKRVMPADEWTASKRERANLAAMRTLVEAGEAALTDAQRRIVARYSGWGGLSIEKHTFPAGFPKPEVAGLIHEYYTPSRVSEDLARMVAPLLADLAPFGDDIFALEPSAGIGRLIRAGEGDAWGRVKWQAVEMSKVSARILAALRPDVELFRGPFEAWVRDRAHAWHGRLHLAMANPPYGKVRGKSAAIDRSTEYREKRASVYFLRRTLDLLRAGGLGVFVVPNGLLSATGKEMRKVRERLLVRHHLSAAFRLPTGIFPGAAVTTDIHIWRARGGELAAVDEADTFILDGKYFHEFPRHVLGTIRKGAGRFRTDIVEGTYEGLPALIERPACDACKLVRDVPAPEGKAAKRRKGARKGGTTIGRTLAYDGDKYDRHTNAAIRLGIRIDRYLAAAAKEDPSAALLAHDELVTDLNAWKSNASANAMQAVRKAANDGVVGAERFVTAWIGGKLSPSIATAPKPPRQRTRLEQAEYVFRMTDEPVVVDTALARELLAGGWCFAGDTVEGFAEVMLPAEAYYSGHLWPRHDVAAAVAKHRGASASMRQVAAAQHDKLHEVIAPVEYDDIDDIDPRQQWIPLRLIAAWWVETRSDPGFRALHRNDGLTEPVGKSYERFTAGTADESILFLGYLNHDQSVFYPRGNKHLGSADDQRKALRAKWTRQFRAWVESSDERRTVVRDAYNRAVRGFKEREYSSAPLYPARWNRDVIPHPHQAAGARRLLAEGRGLLGFDVGVGKTITALLKLALARERRGARRPVIVVPNSVIWQWARVIEWVLPDYAFAVIGSNRRKLKSGPNKGEWTSDRDTGEERARKWTDFQAGLYDVVLVTQTSFVRVAVDERKVAAYAKENLAIRRGVRLLERNAREASTQTERQRALIKEGMEAWVAEQLALPKGVVFDPGVEWSQLGVDLLIVDEAHDYKNSFKPSAREGGTPKYMGGGGAGAKRAWHMDFRAALVQRANNGRGVVLLTATPWKNSPVEVFVMLRLVAADIWDRLGIYDLEGFISRYIDVQTRLVVNGALEAVEAPAAVGFQNLHELRAVIRSVSNFVTAKEAGLKLPPSTVQLHDVDLDARQDALYATMVEELEDALGGDDKDRAELLGMLAKLAVVAIHADGLGTSWKAGWKTPDPESPKFRACVDDILRSPGCNHIVFLEHLGCQRLLGRYLESRGIPARKIAFLNGEAASSLVKRQRIADAFNAGQYKVLVCNKIAEQGLDLQQRTCGVHHLDLPWEPASLRQRNGRGLRQGNESPSVGIRYYLARRSLDGLRYTTIEGKRGWQDALLTSTDRRVENMGAQQDLSADDILYMVTRDPEKTRALLEERKAAAEAKRVAKVRKHANTLLRRLAQRHRLIERAANAERASVFRADAKRFELELSRVSAVDWPFHHLVDVARTRHVFVPEEGVPIYEGQRLALKGTAEGQVDFVEIGRIGDEEFGVRAPGAATPNWWKGTRRFDVLKTWQPVVPMPPWPVSEAEEARVRSEATPSWRDLKWATAATAAELAPRAKGQALRIDSRGRAVFAVYGDVIPPTQEGFDLFVQLFRDRQIGLKSYQVAGAVKEHWFGRFEWT